MCKFYMLAIGDGFLFDGKAWQKVSDDSALLIEFAGRVKGTKVRDFYAGERVQLAY